MDWYREALKRDPYDSRTNTAAGNNYLKNGDYNAARVHFARAIKRLTNNYTRPATGEALYLQGLTLKALGLYEEAADTLYRATWDYAFHSAAYFHLAQISATRGDFDRALYQITESLWTNARNNRAIALKASLQRRKGDFQGAIATLETVLESDPLDFRIRNEYYLATKESGNQQKALELASSLNKEMRDFHENYLELAVGYINDGLFTEAEDALARFKGNNPLIDYYLGFIYDVLGDAGRLQNILPWQKGSPLIIFFHTGWKLPEVLETALQYNPGDGKAYYKLVTYFMKNNLQRQLKTGKML
jgi:tetratricopeptide (TPR) repeat protein